MSQFCPTLAAALLRRSADHFPSFIELLTAKAHAINHSLARKPGYSASLKRCREVSRHSVRLFKQSPEHHDGRGSCLALLGSDGTAGCCSAGAQSIDFTLQPASSRLSSSGAALGQFQFLSCTLTLLVRQSLAALFFFSGLGGSTPVALGYLEAVVGQGLVGLGSLTSGIGRRPISNHHPVLLPAGDQNQSDQPPTPSRYRAEPGHAAPRNRSRSAARRRVRPASTCPPALFQRVNCSAAAA